MSIQQCGSPLALFLLLLLTTTVTPAAEGSGQTDTQCVLPVPDPAALFGSPDPGTPPQLLSTTPTAEYSQCVHQCCHNTDGMCNVLSFSPSPEDGNSAAADPNCALYHCPQLVGCSITAGPADQIFADTQLVQQLLASLFSTQQSPALTNSTSDVTDDNAYDNTDNTGDNTGDNTDDDTDDDTNDNTDDADSHNANSTSTLSAGNSTSVPGDEGGEHPSPSSQKSGLDSAEGDAQNGETDSGGLSTASPNTTQSMNNQTTVIYKDVFESTVEESGESQPASDGANGTQTRKPASGDDQQAPGTVSPETLTTASNETVHTPNTSSLSPTEAADSDTTTGTATASQPGTEEQPEPTEDSNATNHATNQASANTTPWKQQGHTNDSDQDTPPRPPSVATPTATSSGAELPPAPPVIQTTTEHAPSGGHGTPHPSSNVTSKPDQVPTDGTNNVTTPAAAESDSSGKQNVTTGHPQTTSAHLHTPSPQEEGEQTTQGTPSSENSGTSLSSAHDVTLGPDVSAGAVDDVINTTREAEGTQVSDKGTPPVTTTVQQGHVPSGANQTFNETGAAPDLTQEGHQGEHGSDDQAEAGSMTTTMTVLIVALTLGCFFFLVSLVLMGKRLADCWRNRQYSQINRDYLIDGMYDE